MDYFAKLRNTRVAPDSIPSPSYLRKFIDSQEVATRLNLAFPLVQVVGRLTLGFALLRLVLIIQVASVHPLASRALSWRVLHPVNFVLFSGATVSDVLS